MNEGERQALLTQVTMHVDAAEKKLRSLGLATVKVGLYDEVTRQPMNHPNQVICMAEGWCMNCLAGPKKDGKMQHDEACEYRPKEDTPE